MKFKPIKTMSSTDIFVNQLKTAILTGKYSAGDKLPSERELAQQLEVSTNVINSGLKRLARLHFIDIHPRHGAFVADFRTEGDLETLNEIINFYGGHYRRSLLKSLLQIREQFEKEIIISTCEHANEKDLRKLSELLALSTFKQDSNETSKQVFAFIHQISITSKNQVYPLLINNFKKLYLTLNTWICNEIGSQTFLKQNQELALLIMKREKERAIKYNHQLIHDAYKILTKVD